MFLFLLLFTEPRDAIEYLISRNTLSTITETITVMTAPEYGVLSDVTRLHAHN